jgi:hypothetical protein
MHVEIVIAIIIAVPVVLAPAAYLWYMSLGGVFSGKAKEKRAGNK